MNDKTEKIDRSKRKRCDNAIKLIIEQNETKKIKHNHFEMNEEKRKFEKFLQQQKNEPTNNNLI